MSDKILTSNGPNQTILYLKLMVVHRESDPPTGLWYRSHLHTWGQARTAVWTPQMLKLLGPIMFFSGETMKLSSTAMTPWDGTQHLVLKHTDIETL